MRIHEGDIRSRARKAGEDPRFTLVALTPAVVSQERQALAATVTAREPDPLADKAKGYVYHVASPDVLSVTVWEHPELTIPAGEFRADTATGSVIMPDGNMFYPHAGLVNVGGKTLPEVRDLLTQKLAKVLEKPQLDVRVASYRAYKVVVTGQVKNPTTVPITDIPLRVLDAVSACQGVTAEADLKHVVLTRAGKSHMLDLQATSEEGDLSQNWLLIDGDVVNVPDRSLEKVFVVGEVRQPATRFMPNGRLTLADALSDSGWLDPTSSNAAGIYVIRGDYQKPKVFRLDATSPDSLLLASAFPLHPLDVVFVSTYKLTQWNRIVTQILPTIQAVTQMVTEPAIAARLYTPNALP